MDPKQSVQSSAFPLPKEFDNYCKSLLAVNITREAILPDVCETIKEFQKKCLNGICVQHICEDVENPAERKCADSVYCQFTNICDNVRCHFVDCPSATENDNKRCCLGKIYMKFIDEIKENHRYKLQEYPPKASVKKWCSNFWELAKCFMPINGYRKIIKPEETDFNGIINVVINHKKFPENSIFEQGRVIVNQLRHSATLEISNFELDGILTDLNEILIQKIFFLGARDARMHLEQFREKKSIPPEDVKVLLQIIEDTSDSNKRETLKRTLLRDPELSRLMKREENQTIYEMPNLCTREGKLIKLHDNQLKGILQHCKKPPIEGGFGKVHKSTVKVPGLDIRVVLKEIRCKDTELTKISTTFKEIISSRVMHFAIVPLVGYNKQEVKECSESIYYFLSPYLENGSLRTCIENDYNEKDRSKIKMDYKRRIEILFQGASAIHYLHTPVKGYRGIVLHMDVTSSNIVLDEHWNARLTDFGLAHEMKEGQTDISLTKSKQFGTPGYFRTQRYSDLTVSEDYYNFGVVIREVLTGKAPYINTSESKAEEIRHYGKETIKRSLQENVWKVEKDENSKVEDDDRDVEKKVDVLTELSTRCLNIKDRSLTSADIVDALKQIRVPMTVDFARVERKKCDICMTNECVNHNKGLTFHDCRCSIHVCLSCMRNSNLNPIICPTCGEKVIPEIGYTYGAVLIAGNDPRKSYAQSFCDDVEEVKIVLASKYPCVIGISEENIRVVTPDTPGQSEDLLPKISAAFDFLEKCQSIKTLLFYYTGHFDSGFMLEKGRSVLTVAELQEHFKRVFRERKETSRIIAFLDCCEAPDIDLKEENKQFKMFQLNVCRQNEGAYQRADGSRFRKFFVQALTRKIFNKDCLLSAAGCNYCEISGDFISVPKLLEYIDNHITFQHKDRKPVIYLPKPADLDDICFGYNIDFAAEFTLKFLNRNNKETTKIEIEPGIYCQINQLKSSIHHFLKDKKDETLMFPSNKFLDTLSLHIDNGQQYGEELQSMLHVSAAMDNQQCVVVCVKPVSSILKGRVALFPPKKEIEDLKSKGLLKEMNDAPVIALSKDQFGKVIDQIKKDADLKSIVADLNEVFKIWDNSKTSSDIKEIKISFPDKDDGSHEFILLELIKENK